MNKNEDIRKKVSTWLSTQGYSLEMRTAKEFQIKSFSVNSGIFYKNRNNNTAREIDLQIYRSTFINKSNLIFTINFIVECKYSKDNPWVLFKSNNGSLKYSDLGFQNASKYGQIALLEMFVSHQFKDNFLFKLPSKIYYGATRAFENKKDISYTAIMNVCNAIDSIVIEEDEKSEFFKAFNANIYFPLIIVDSKIFDCFLNDSNNIELEEIKFGRLYWQNPELKNSRYLIDVVSFDYLQDYIELVKNSTNDIIQFASVNLNKTVELMLKNIDNI